MTETNDLPPGAVLAETWEDCAAHLGAHAEHGGRVVMKSPVGWEPDWSSPPYPQREGWPGRGGFWPRALLPPVRRESTDPDELAAAVAAGVEVETLPPTYQLGWRGSELRSSHGFREAIAIGFRYRLPVSWKPEATDLRERVAKMIEDFEDLIGHCYLHMDDEYVRRKMTTEERQLYDSSKARWSARLEDEPVDPHPVLAELAPELAPAPDGTEAVYLPPDAVDEFAGWRGEWGGKAPRMNDVVMIEAIGDAARATQARRPKPARETERVLLPIRVEPDEDDGGFVASCAVPGIHGQGETIPDAVADLIEAARAAGSIA